VGRLSALVRRFAAMAKFKSIYFGTLMFAIMAAATTVVA
jgi:hypothetical protein